MQSAEFTNPPADLPDIDELPPRNCPECGCFLKREWNAEFDWREYDGHVEQVVVYYQQCRRCNHMEKRVV